MNNELPPDDTVQAIEEVTATMTGEDRASTAVDPGLLNREAEKNLIDASRLTQSSYMQRALIGCIACKLGPGSEAGGSISLNDLAECSGSPLNAFRQAFERFLKAGVLSNQNRPGSTIPSTLAQYALGVTGRREAFRSRLEKPKQCGLDIPLEPAAQTTENALLEEGFVTQRSPMRRSVLACLGCRLHAGEEGIHATGVKDCKGLEHTTAYQVLRKMVANGILQTRREPIPQERPSGTFRVIYSPADTPLGERYRELLQSDAPKTCGRGDKQ